MALLFEPIFPIQIHFILSHQKVWHIVEENWLVEKNGLQNDVEWVLMNNIQTLIKKAEI